MNQPRLLVFDFDGTIADSIKFLPEVATAVFESQGIATTDMNLDEIRQLSVREVLKKHRIPLRRLPAITRTAKAVLQAKIDEITPVHGMPALLTKLANEGTNQLALLTSNNRENVDHFMQKHDLADFFTRYECNVGVLTKYTRLRRLARTVGAQRQVISVGDEIRDIDAARRARVRSIAVTWGLNSEARLKRAKPDYIARTVAELDSALQTITP